MTEPTYTTLQEIVDQLRACNYENEAGLLYLNVAFQALEEMAVSNWSTEREQDIAGARMIESFMGNRCRQPEPPPRRRKR